MSSSPDRAVCCARHLASDGFFLTTGAAGATDVCTACTTPSSRVSACLTGHDQTVGADEDTVNNVVSTSDTCTPRPCVATNTITVKVDNNATNTQAETTVDDIDSFLLTISPAADMNSGTNAAVPCVFIGSPAAAGTYSGTVGVTLSCSLGQLTVDAEDCVHYDTCGAGVDDCLGLVVGVTDEHLCTSTGPATHACSCLNNAYGTATNPAGSDGIAGNADDDAAATQCTACPANSVSNAGVQLVTDCSCSNSFGVGGTASQAVIDANTVCAAVVCPTYSSGSWMRVRQRGLQSDDGQPGRFAGKPTNNLVIIDVLVHFDVLSVSLGRRRVRGRALQ